MLLFLNLSLISRSQPAKSISVYTSIPYKPQESHLQNKKILVSKMESKHSFQQNEMIQANNCGFIFHLWTEWICCILLLLLFFFISKHHLKSMILDYLVILKDLLYLSADVRKWDSLQSVQSWDCDYVQQHISIGTITFLLHCYLIGCDLCDVYQTCITHRSCNQMVKFQTSAS